ncbi:MAG: glycogen debranching protein [Planctomycetota bacterium]|jgi:glycogen operon protein
MQVPPLSPLVTAEGTRFRVLSRDRPTLQLYAGPDDTGPEATHLPERQGDLWEVVVPGVAEGALYTWAVDPQRPLVDPYCLEVMGPERFGADDPERVRPPFEEMNRGARFKSVVRCPSPPPGWERPGTPWSESVVYELHVRGFTRHASSRSAAPGTYRGLIERIDHLRDLGVTAVELLPVHEFDETEVRRSSGLFNFWGYSPIAWMAPNRRYAQDTDPIGEFRAMVRAFHDAGIEVLIDVVFNHTAELHARGPTWNLRALDGERYYLPEDLTGCGNTVRAQHPTVRRLILDALRWWVHGMGVDGFRFDLATILARDLQGEVSDEPPLIREIEEDESLQGVHLVAEAWDAASGYLVGGWPGGERWAVWNDRFRDDVRRAWLSGQPRAGTLASRLSGSSELFSGYGPPRSLNYLTAHDGFTLLDAVSYSRRHNKANLEGNNDGHAHEIGANHGREGPSRSPAIRAARNRARRNLMATLLLSQGVPMLLGGDEFGRTQKGNNNAYCHDSRLTWVDWTGLRKDRAFHRFVRGLIRLRRSTPALQRTQFLKDSDIRWLGPEGGPVDWEGDAVAFHLSALYAAFNLGGEPRTFALPPGRMWRVVADTAATPPLDYHEPDGAPVLDAREITACAKSVMLLLSGRPGED